MLDIIVTKSRLGCICECQFALWLQNTIRAAARPQKARRPAEADRPLSSSRVTGWPDHLLAPAWARLARHSRNSRYRGSCGATAAAGADGVTLDADDMAAPAGSGMLRSSHSSAALKRVQPDTVARGAISFHFGWNGGRCNCATLSNMVSTRSDRRR